IPATVAAGLLIVQVVLGAITVRLELPPMIVLARLATAMALLGAVCVTAVAALTPAPAGTLDRSSIRWTLLAAGGTYLLIISGSLVVGSGASGSCDAWPLCGGGFSFGFDGLPAIQLLHRGVAAVIGLLIVYSLVSVLARHQRGRGISAPTVPSPRRGSGIDIERRPARDVVLDYVSLAKPRIIPLLLITALGGMMMAERGWPSTGLVVLTLLGGALAAAGAGAINCWIDRDLDGAMLRTRRRPLPDGRIAPSHALLFGIALGLAAFVLLAFWVNVLTATLAISGLLFYVFVYTLWLKRWTVQNIVIGGAAGAVPPVVGWAAVTHRVDLTAIYLFAVIFLWTPPHFWALALRLKGDYARAHVPMLPVVRGEAVARRQILFYTLVLVAVTLAVVVTGALGLLYLAGAAVLGS